MVRSAYLPIQEDFHATNWMEILYCKSIVTFGLYLLGRKEDARAVLRAGPFDEIEQVLDWLAETSGGQVRPRGEEPSEENMMAFFVADDFVAHAKFLELLVDDETLQAIWAVRKRLADLPHDEAARTIASDLEGTLDNATYLAGAGGSSTR